MTDEATTTQSTWEVTQIGPYDFELRGPTGLLDAQVAGDVIFVAGPATSELCDRTDRLQLADHANATMRAQFVHMGRLDSDHLTDLVVQDYEATLVGPYGTVHPEDLSPNLFEALQSAAETTAEAMAVAVAQHPGIVEALRTSRVEHAAMLLREHPVRSDNPTLQAIYEDVLTEVILQGGRPPLHPATHCDTDPF